MPFAESTAALLEITVNQVFVHTSEQTFCCRVGGGETFDRDQQGERLDMARRRVMRQPPPVRNADP